MCQRQWDTDLLGVFGFQYLPLAQWISSKGFQWGARRMACTQPWWRIRRRFAFSGGYSGQTLKGMDDIYLLSFTLQVSQRKVGLLAIKSVGWQWHYKLEDSWVSTVLWKRFGLKWFLPPVSSWKNSNSFQCQRHQNRNITLKKKKKLTLNWAKPQITTDYYWLMLSSKSPSKKDAHWIPIA